MSDLARKKASVQHEIDLMRARARLLEIRPASQKGTYDYPVEIESVTGIINVARGLLKYGYSYQDVEKTLGENWIRVYKKGLQYETGATWA